MRILWLAIVAGVAVGALLTNFPHARIGVPRAWREGAVLSLILAGIVVRWSAILTLGRLFTVNVAIQEDHRLVQEGLYRYLRHPSYTGMLISFLGLGLNFGNWVSLLAVLVPIVAAVLNRVRIEESALVEGLGSQYLEYCRSTKRLIPWVY